MALVTLASTLELSGPQVTGAGKVLDSLIVLAPPSTMANGTHGGKESMENDFKHGNSTRAPRPKMAGTARRKGSCYSTTELNQAAVRVMIVQKVLIFVFCFSA